ncbi:D-alanyl-D-alanine dipeptidase [candidate division KSB1 bacterium]|nr:D-alanyl-D-alanine dipeptidase [candidate division KSB1 bacterium]
MQPIFQDSQTSHLIHKSKSTLAQKWRSVRLQWIPVFIFSVFLSNALLSQPPSEEPLVDVAKLDSTLVIDLRYATTRNFLGVQLYAVNRCLLRQSVAERLVRVQQYLRRQGFGLKIWDAYRPLAVQKLFWQYLPNPRYVAPPEKGSRHNRGAAVDVTLVDSTGREVEMPTDFDDFSVRAAPDYEPVSAPVRRHRQILIDAMTRMGFVGISSEWWHFDAPHYRQYSILDLPLEKIK